MKPVYLPLTDKVTIRLGTPNSVLDYTLQEFDDIPVNEMVNIIGTVSERWLERQQFIYTQDVFDESVLRSCSMQIKLVDNRFDRKTG